MIHCKSMVVGLGVSVAMLIGCASATEQSSVENETLEGATIEPSGTSYLVTGVANGVRKSVLASEVRIVDAVTREVSGIQPSAVKYRCYVCACGGGQCECSEIPCPEP